MFVFVSQRVVSFGIRKVAGSNGPLGNLLLPISASLFLSFLPKLEFNELEREAEEKEPFSFLSLPGVRCPEQL